MSRNAPGGHNWFWPLALMAAVTAVSGTSNPQLPVGFTFHDKLAHFLVFGLIATCWVRLLYPRMGWGGLVLSALIPALFGLADELHQSTVPGRLMEFDDWLADALGALVAVYAYRFIGPYRRLLEWVPLVCWRKKSDSPR